MLAGLVSFASPCVVPLVPGYLSYLAAIVGGWPPGGVALRTARLRVAGAALFVAGFTVVFVLGSVAVLGMTTALIANQVLLQRIGGVVTIVMGLVFIGFVPLLQREARFAPRQPLDPRRGAAAGRGVRAGLDAVPGPDADRGDRGVLGDRGLHGGPRRHAGDRLLPGPGHPVRVVGLRVGAGGARAGLAARAHPGHPDLRRRADDRGRYRAGDRALGRLRGLGARRLRQRRDGCRYDGGQERGDPGVWERCGR